MSDFLLIAALSAGPAVLIAVAWRVAEKVFARRRACADARYRHPASRTAQVRDIGDVTIELPDDPARDGAHLPLTVGGLVLAQEVENYLTQQSRWDR